MQYELTRQSEMLTTHDFMEFQRAYIEACDLMYTASEYAYKLYNEYGNTFRAYCTGTINISESTFSKMIKAGELINTNPSLNLKDMEYSKIYELKDVQGEMNEYSNFIADKYDKCVNELTQREIKKTIKEFWQANTEEPETVIKEEKHPQTAAPALNKWDELEDAIINGVNTQGLLKLFYALKKEVNGE